MTGHKGLALLGALQLVDADGHSVDLAVFNKFNAVGFDAALVDSVEGVDCGAFHCLEVLCGLPLDQ